MDDVFVSVSAAHMLVMKWCPHQEGHCPTGDMQVCENEAREKHTKKPTVICSPYNSDICKITIEDQSSVLGLAITHLKEKKKYKQ